VRSSVGAQNGIFCCGGYLLAKRSLLQRASNPADGRATDVFLTSEGMQLVDLGEGKIARSLSPMTGKLTRTETRRLTALLEHVL
jgi:hypothetical protein